MTAIYILVITF